MKKKPDSPISDPAAAYLLALGERIDVVANMLGGKRALATYLGIHESMLYRYIKGENALSAPLLVALADAAKVNLNWLATGAGIAKRKADMLSEANVASYQGGPGADPEFGVVQSCDKSAAASLAFDAHWLQQLSGARHSQVCLKEVRGEDMEPTLRSGDLVLLDLRVTKVDQDGLYGVQLPSGVEIKRVQKRPAGGLRLSSDNPNCESATLARAAAGRLRLVGRVIWFGRRL